MDIYSACVIEIPGWLAGLPSRILAKTANFNSRPRLRSMLKAIINWLGESFVKYNVTTNIVYTGERAADTKMPMSNIFWFTAFLVFTV